MIPSRFQMLLARVAVYYTLGLLLQDLEVWQLICVVSLTLVAELIKEQEIYRGLINTAIENKDE